MKKEIKRTIIIFAIFLIWLNGVWVGILLIEPTFMPTEKRTQSHFNWDYDFTNTEIKPYIQQRCLYHWKIVYFEDIDYRGMVGKRLFCLPRQYKNY